MVFPRPDLLYAMGVLKYLFSEVSRASKLFLKAKFIIVSIPNWVAISFNLSKSFWCSQTP